ncbi:hypothetical protein E2C01_037388 [Portunus trituberculatus]|uniref:Uncharacterized protein n=1 Tax=Portunus trituberculatus TaxID=210409 RepID=A0A5B7FEH5_PORTR|nr:hypothetical protein [Portunus trituberculatus]
MLRYNKKRYREVASPDSLIMTCRGSWMEEAFIAEASHLRLIEHNLHLKNNIQDLNNDANLQDYSQRSTLRHS